MIKQKIEKLKKDILKKQQEIINLQSECQHENLIGKYSADTGNWCRDDDSYWVDFKCEDCGKQWMEDQTDIGYLTSKQGFKFRKV